MNVAFFFWLLAPRGYEDFHLFLSKQKSVCLTVTVACFVISPDYSQIMYLMKLLRDQGLPSKELHCIFHALVVNK